jgi:hypothetical protein
MTQTKREPRKNLDIMTQINLETIAQIRRMTNKRNLETQIDLPALSAINQDTMLLAVLS